MKGSTIMSNLHRFIRNVSPKDLQSHLSQSEIPVPVLNWEAPAEEFSKRFLEAVDELPEQKLSQLIADIDRISGMTDEVGQAALMSLAEWRAQLRVIDSAYSNLAMHFAKLRKFATPTRIRTRRGSGTASSDHG
jgi:hypothetical protein